MEAEHLDIGFDRQRLAHLRLDGEGPMLCLGRLRRQIVWQLLARFCSHTWRNLDYF